VLADPLAPSVIMEFVNKPQVSAYRVEPHSNTLNGVLGMYFNARAPVPKFYCDRFALSL
jgi:hypothetical protein